MASFLAKRAFWTPRGEELTLSGPVLPAFRKENQRYFITKIFCYLSGIVLLPLPVLILIPTLIVIYIILKLRKNVGVQEESSRTAKAVALLRDIGYINGLTDDYLAWYFLPISFRPIHFCLSLVKFVLGYKVRYRTGGRGIYGYLCCRTLIFDRLIENAKLKQVVLLGSGYDTRFHRLNLPADTKCFEVDILSTQTEKRQKVAKYPKVFKNKEIVYVAVDFSKNESFIEKLVEHGFDKTIPTTFLFEGVTYYIPFESVVETLQMIAGCAPGSLLGVDFFEDVWTDGRAPSFYGGQQLVNQVARLGEPFKFGLKENDLPEKKFSKYGLELILHLGPQFCEQKILTPPGEKTPVTRVSEIGQLVCFEINGKPSTEESV